MDTGKRIRLSRILQKGSNKSVIVPIDHGLTVGPLPGLESTRSISRWLISPNVDAIIAHKGMITRLAERDLLHGRGVILHLNGMSSLSETPDDKEMLTQVRMATELGVDGVSLQINFTGRNDAQNLRLLGRISDLALRSGLPLLTMLYDKVSGERKVREQRARHLLRTTVELGSDAVKIALCEEAGELEALLADVHEDILVFVAGGALTREEVLLARVREAMECGAAGVCVGRNVFAQKKPQLFLERLADVVHRGVSLATTRGELLHAY